MAGKSTRVTGKNTRMAGKSTRMAGKPGSPFAKGYLRKGQAK